MEFELDDRFLRDLNPDLHFKAIDGGYRLTSAVFRDRRAGAGFYACSVDSERFAGENAPGARAGRGHRDWGVGRVTLEAVRDIGEGDVTHQPRTRQRRPLHADGPRGQSTLPGTCLPGDDGTHIRTLGY